MCFWQLLCSEKILRDADCGFRILLAGPTKPSDMVRTIICPGKTSFPFNCEGKLVISYSVRGPELKLFSLGILGMFALCDESGLESEQSQQVSIDSDMDTSETSSSDLDTESLEKKNQLNAHFPNIQFLFSL